MAGPNNAMWNLRSAGGVAPYGIRHSGKAPKGLGYFGPLSHAGGSTSTELSFDFDTGQGSVDAPLLVPTLSYEEIQHLLSGSKPTREIYEKVQSWAQHRISSGKSPFAGPQDLRHPMPQQQKSLSDMGPGILSSRTGILRSRAGILRRRRAGDTQE